MRTLGILATACVVGLVSTSVTAGASQPQPYSGQGDFQTYCSACHGVGAKGDGAIASSLRKRPPDLTKLAQRNNGTYPTEIVFKTIDGRTPTSGHGGPDMPVWSDVFAKSSESEGPEAAKARIDALVQYLETIQEKR
jgi:mono/diheme cytochrome c family protein